MSSEPSISQIELGDTSTNNNNNTNPSKETTLYQPILRDERFWLSIVSLWCLFLGWAMIVTGDLWQGVQFLAIAWIPFTVAFIYIAFASLALQERQIITKYSTGDHKIYVPTQKTRYMALQITALVFMMATHFFAIILGFIYVGVFYNDAVANRDAGRQLTVLGFISAFISIAGLILAIIALVRQIRRYKQQDKYFSFQDNQQQDDNEQQQTQIQLQQYPQQQQSSHAPQQATGIDTAESGYNASDYAYNVSDNGNNDNMV